eukprot:scaffold224974_cov59-Attheya_sp.AAC.1
MMRGRSSDAPVAASEQITFARVDSESVNLDAQCFIRFFLNLRLQIIHIIRDRVDLNRISSISNRIFLPVIVELDRTGLDWTGLDWTGLDWTGLDWTGLDWTGLDWTGLD